MKNITIKSFNQLTTNELYDILTLRVNIFVVEQTCPYPELDGLDTLAGTRHLSILKNDELIAYARCIAPGDSYPSSAAIGRVVVAESARGAGVAKKLMREAIACCKSEWPEVAIEISAQCYLTDFYQSLGFSVEGESYLEDGIPHIHMKLD